MYKSVSAFAPIANPINCPWGQKAFEGYFGKEEKDRERWAQHDATELVKKWDGEQQPLDVLVDVVCFLSAPLLFLFIVFWLNARGKKKPQGTADTFYKQGQLLPENFVKAAEEGKKGKVNLRWQDGYDHSYFTMASFADDHVNHAARYLLEEGAAVA